MKNLYLILSTLIITCQSAFGQIPQTTNFQGLLTESDGAVVSDGDHSLNFKLYSSVSGEEILWEETQKVSTTDGIFNVILGKVNELNIPFDKPYWLEITIDNEEELSPRIELTSSFYSLMTKSIEDSTISTVKLQDNSVTTEKLSNGSVTQEKLHSSLSIPLSGKAGGDLVGNYPNPQIGDNSVDSTNVKNNAITEENIKPNILSSINKVSNDGGNINLLEGENITIIPNVKLNSITISALSDSTRDNLGNHTAIKNIKLNGKWLSGDGEDEGIFIDNAGNVGIGTQNMLSKLSIGGSGKLDAAFYSHASLEGGIGVYGLASDTDEKINYGGYFESYGEEGRGVSGSSHGLIGIGGYFRSSGFLGRGVYGSASNNGKDANYGGYFMADGMEGRGVYGYASNSEAVANNYGGYFESAGMEGCGVYGFSPDKGGCFVTNGTEGRAVVGIANGISEDNSPNKNYGGYFTSYGRGGAGIYASALIEAYYAGYFNGHVHVTGTITAGSKKFKIDHPLDPANKYLNHSSVESSEMKNIYDGTIITNEKSEAEIELPEWFEALNNNFRYQLTVIGEFAQAIISEEINNNKFTIKTSKPNVKVSWQVTGIRKDAFANANRTVVEEMKVAEDKGKYLYPTVYNMPRSSGIDFNEKIEQERVELKIERRDELRRHREESARIKRENSNMKTEVN